MSVLSVCEWLQNLPWATGIKHSAWQFPVVESIHSLGLSGMGCPVAMLDLRLLGVAMRRRPVSQVASQFLPWVWTGFTLMIFTGALLFASEAVAGLNALVFQKTVFHGIHTWDKDAPTPWRAKVAGGGSLLVWVGVVAMGRALAYA